MAQVKMNVKSPKKINSRVKAICSYLDIDEENYLLLKYSSQSEFKPKVKNCFFNVWAKIHIDGGNPQCGWIIAEDQSNDFVEAIFHSVWVSADGETRDVTPREDNEKRVMFVPDYERRITLTEYNDNPAINTFDNVRIIKGQLLTGLKQIFAIPDIEFLRNHGLINENA